VKVASNFFLISLSSAEADMQRNVELLRERSSRRGASGERAFSEAFAAWEE
jgi:hypothetical protein